ncbi:uncharacterized protein METZ01_LOCUS467465, partial [marine metagenome]
IDSPPKSVLRGHFDRLTVEVKKPTFLGLNPAYNRISHAY